MKELKQQTHNENKVKLKQIKIFANTRNEEIKKLNENIENYKKKQTEITLELHTDFKFPFSKIFSIFKSILALFIIFVTVILVKEKLMRA
jgi:hypothetical protein